MASNRRDFVKKSLLACAAAGIPGALVAAQPEVIKAELGSETEWDAQKASEFWPEQRSHWTPVSWKDHPYNFNILYNGTIVANPSNSDLNPFIFPEDKAFGAELRVQTSLTPMGASGVDAGLYRRLNPDGQQVPSWSSSPAPVYVLEHTMRKSVIYVEQQQFAHVPGGQLLKQANEPHFLWVRFVVSDVVEFINTADHFYVYLSFLKPNTQTEIAAFNNINPNYGFGTPGYSFPLHLDHQADWTKPTYLRLGQQARAQARPPVPYRRGLRNRLAFPAGQKGIQVKYLESRLFIGSAEPLCHIELKIPAKVGAKIDFVLPMVPTDDVMMERELSLGYEGALAEAEVFWKKELASRTSVRVPEPLVQGYLTTFPRFQAMLGQKDPTTGAYAIRTSSMHYEIPWSTPTAWAIYGLDLLGHHQETEKYLETYRQNQGVTKPSSQFLNADPGYFGPPATISHVNWITDHAAILWAAANHGLLTRDGNFQQRWEIPIVKACEFIRSARRTRGHGGYEGILPPGNPNDTKMLATQFVWNDAWYHKALRTGARFLEEIGNPRGAEFRREADDYRSAFQKAFREVVAKTKRWQAPDGTMVPFVPMALSQPKHPTVTSNDAPQDGDDGNSSEAINLSAGHPFFLDTGSLALVFGELFPASDPIMQAATRWFREGPQVKHYRPYSCPYQPPVLWAEVSSCEPLYSFNLFHTFELEDRNKFAMGLYGQFAGGHCRGSFVGCETREGVFGLVNTLPLLLTRMALIHEEEGDLHLLKMAPLAFFRGEGFEWKNAPTQFGELSIAARWDEPSRRLSIDYHAPSRSSPKRTTLHLPRFPSVVGITLNGRELSEKTGTITL